MIRRAALFHLRVELAGQVLTARIQQEVDAFSAGGGWEGGGRDKVRWARMCVGGYACCYNAGPPSESGGEDDNGCCWGSTSTATPACFCTHNPIPPSEPAQVVRGQALFPVPTLC